MVGAFSHKFSIPPCGKITDRIEKLGVAKMVWTSSITMTSIVWIVGCAPAVDDKVMFYCSFVRPWNYKIVITETL